MKKIYWIVLCSLILILSQWRYPGEVAFGQETIPGQEFKLFFPVVVDNYTSLEDERQALIVILQAGYQGIDIADSSHCTWPGVLCGGDRVGALNLQNARFNGPLPAEIGRIMYLHALEAGCYRDFLSHGLGTGRCIGSPGLTSLPPEIGKLSHLSILNLEGNLLTSLPPEIGDLAGLSFLKVHENQLTNLPVEIGNLPNLSYLDTHSNQLSSIPSEIGDLFNLNKLDLSHNQLTSLPSEIVNLSNLSYLDVSHNHLVSLTNLDVLAFLDAKDPDWRNTQTSLR